MKYIIFIFGRPLGYLMHLCFTATNNYGAAIILFTIVSRVILFPVLLMAYKNSIKLAKIAPRLNDIKRHYSGDKRRISEEQLKLYEEENCSSLTSLLPLFIQVFLLIGLVHVMYSPLSYLVQAPPAVADSLVAAAAEIDTLGAARQLKTIDLIKDPAYTAVFTDIAPEWIPKILQISLEFLGLNMGVVPAFRWSPYLWVPVFAGAASLILCLVQNRIHVSQREQSRAYKYGMTAFFTAFALYFAFTVPAGIGVFWGVSNLLGVLILILSNVILRPDKQIDYSARPKPVPVDKEVKKANRLRERADYKRFMAAKNKKLVFYSIKNGAYKYFKEVLEYVLNNSDITIHYVASDPDDVILKGNVPGLETYYIGDKRLIALFTYLDADMMVMTTPDLQRYHLKRSALRKDIEYVYMFHAVLSTHMVYRTGAFNHFDTVFCVGQYHIDEIRATEKEYGLKQKRLIPCGYGLIDELTAEYASMEKANAGAKKILIAPSWHFGNIMESCLDGLLEQLLGRGYQIVVRPHPEFVKRFPDKIRALLNRYGKVSAEELIIETDFTSNVTIFTADLLITDWSGITFEYAYATKRPCLLINTPMKVLNSEYKKIGVVPIEISLRDKVGISIDTDKITEAAGAVERLFAEADSYSRQISQVLEENMFCIGEAGKTGGEYILKRLKGRRT